MCIPAQSHFLATQCRYAAKKADTLEHRKRLLPWEADLPKVMPWLLMYDYAAKFPSIKKSKAETLNLFLPKHLGDLICPDLWCIIEKQIEV